MFEWTKNIWDAIKGFFSFFESVLTYIKAAFDMLTAVIKFPLDVIETFASAFPSIITVCAMTCLFVWVIRQIVGRGD